MACPLCGDVCQCIPDLRLREDRLPQRSRFQLDEKNTHLTSSAAVLIDPEAYDSSEESFSASLEPCARSQTRTEPQKRFVPDPAESMVPEALGEREIAAAPPPAEPDIIAENAASHAFVPASTPEADPSSWKQEVAERLNSYRARRKPRPPKYPSLSLTFEPELRPGRAPSIETAALAAAQPVFPDDNPRADALARETSPPPPARRQAVIQDAPETYSGGRIIEFPRFYGPPEPSADELAETVCERPRILDAPEVELPPPALGGITLEPEPVAEPELRPGFEVPLQTSPLTRRLLAAACDSVLVLSACTLFGYIFFRMSKVLPPSREMVSMGIAIAAVLWAGYQYLLLTYSGTTPGLRLVKLRVSQFDGTGVSRRMRRWRALASILSAVSLGLGFAWCFLDEDSLCWHDRITHTYLAPLE
jgi:uncharacterized RDD family membrane protein YckC